MVFWSLFFSNRIEDAISWMSALINLIASVQRQMRTDAVDAAHWTATLSRARPRALSFFSSTVARHLSRYQTIASDLSCLFVRNGSWWEVYLLFSCCSWQWARLWWARGKRGRSAAGISWKMSSSGSPPSTSTAARSSTGTASETWVSPPLDTV